jgi:hypothetical protein
MAALQFVYSVNKHKKHNGWPAGGLPCLTVTEELEHHCPWLYLSPIDTIRAIDKIESGEAMRQWKERSAASSLEVESEVAVEVNAMARHRQLRRAFPCCSPKRMCPNIPIRTLGNKLHLLEPCLLHRLRYFIILMLCAFSVGRAGFRSGWESVAYVDEASSTAPSGSQASLINRSLIFLG